MEYFLFFIIEHAQRKCNYFLHMSRAHYDIVGSWGKLGDRPHRGYNNQWKRHHSLTQNFKAMGLWVLLLIRCSTFAFLSDVGHITHTCTQHSPSSVSPSIHYAPPQAEALTCLYQHACTAVAAFCATDRLPQSYPLSNRGSDTIVGSWEEPGGPSTSRLEQPH